jgi:hypothetical protein
MRWSGAHLTIGFDPDDDGVSITDFRADDEAVQAQGGAHLRADWERFLRDVGTRSHMTLRDPDPALRILFEQFGFRGATGPGREMRYDPQTPPPLPVFLSVRPGGFSAGSLIRLADGRCLPACELDVGDELDEGGTMTEIIEGLISETCRCESGSVSALSAVWDGCAWVRVADHPDFTPEHRPEGVRTFFLTTRTHRVRVGERVFTDSWETEAARQERLSMLPYVLSVLNGTSADA